MDLVVEFNDSNENSWKISIQSVSFNKLNFGHNANLIVYGNLFSVVVAAYLNGMSFV